MCCACLPGQLRASTDTSKDAWAEEREGVLGPWHDWTSCSLYWPAHHPGSRAQFLQGPQCRAGTKSGPCPHAGRPFQPPEEDEAPSQQALPLTQEGCVQAPASDRHCAWSINVHYLFESSHSGGKTLPQEGRKIHSRLHGSLSPLSFHFYPILSPSPFWKSTKRSTIYQAPCLCHARQAP